MIPHMDAECSGTHGILTDAVPIRRGSGVVGMTERFWPRGVIRYLPVINIG